MSVTFISMSISLDGYIAKSDISKERPFGTGGDRLYDWLFKEKTDIDTGIVDNLMKRTGAVIAGAKTYEISIDSAWGRINPFNAPVFVVASQVPDNPVDGFTFVTDGIESALTRAKAAAGAKDIWIMGGASVAQQYLKAGLVDELYVHIAPTLFGGGIQLWNDIGSDIVLNQQTTVQTPGATHINYKVVR